MAECLQWQAALKRTDDDPLTVPWRGVYRILKIIHFMWTPTALLSGGIIPFMGELMEKNIPTFVGCGPFNAVLGEVLRIAPAEDTYVLLERFTSALRHAGALALPWANAACACWTDRLKPQIPLRRSPPSKGRTQVSSCVRTQFLAWLTSCVLPCRYIHLHCHVRVNTPHVPQGVHPTFFSRTDTSRHQDARRQVTIH